ncbi:hypothetical protein BT96DRAFT_992115 [Gymnopus androsaceus JB14]|uniref:DUF4470 domain-containing protein n=1 Tax=Gymnopus androsaceus JB14 TaxID=1447944 RepID=A0A6A4HWT3_9AGAR|nr:hypothetical protein BT96DRAFT_992115 [Gymnopus androsaceus JB14]
MDYMKCSATKSFNPLGCDKRGTHACSEVCSFYYIGLNTAHFIKIDLHSVVWSDTARKIARLLTGLYTKRIVGILSTALIGVPAGFLKTGLQHSLERKIVSRTSAHLVHNEGVVESIDKDFNLCFAASGDIRNMVMTLSRHHTKHPHFTCSSAQWHSSSELAAEAAVHIMYSALLRPSDSLQLDHCIDAVYGDILPLLQSSSIHSWIMSNPMWKKSLEVRGSGTLSFAQSTADLVFKEPLDMLRAAHSVGYAKKNMHDIVLSPERIDYRDRYLSGLEPSHRLSFLRFRESGVLLPFSGLDLKMFDDVNRLLFSPTGQWLTMDAANPLFSWNVSEVLKTGQAHGLDRADIYGCLFFHVKAQFIEFARRFERFHIDVHVSQLDASVASDELQKGRLYPSFGTGIKFDRVETSNVADYIGTPRVLKDWSPLLNRENMHAVILVYLMNWVQKQPGASTIFSLGEMKGSNVPMAFQKIASILGIDLPTLLKDRTRHSASFYNIIGNIDTFIDNDDRLQEFLVSDGTKRALEWYDLRLRTKNLIHPRRFGISLGDRPDALPSMTKTEFYNTYMAGGSNAGDRFLEFGHREGRDI